MMRSIRRPSAAFLVALAAFGCGEPGTGPAPKTYPPDRSRVGVRLSGPTRVLAILTQYADSPAPQFSPSSIASFVFGTAHDGRVSQLFFEASEGAFELSGDVVGPVKTSVRTGTYFLHGFLSPTRETDHVIEAIRGVESAVDFGRYDNDGPDGEPNSGDDDGLVDGGVVILHTEIDSHCGDGGVGRGQHPHANTNWVLPPANFPYFTDDSRNGGGAIAIRGFTIMSSMECSGQQVGHAVLAHELGHLLLGLPDFYHAISSGLPIWGTRRWVIGCWELMAAGGSWGCGRGTPDHSRRASGFAAWSRIDSKWATPVVVRTDRDSVYELRPVGLGGTVLRIPVTEGEYLLAEYREPLGADLSLPGAGVLLYRVRENLPVLPPNSPGVPPKVYRVMLLEADADSGLTRTDPEGGDRGSATDGFGGPRDSFVPGVHPEAHGATGAPLSFKLTEIVVDPAAHRARIRVSPHPQG